MTKFLKIKKLVSRHTKGFQAINEHMLLQNCGQIRIGETVIQVTGTLKKCYPEICSLAARKEHCSLKEQCVFGMILRSGRICIGDEVEILEKDPAGKMTEDPELKIDKTSL